MGKSLEKSKPKTRRKTKKKIIIKWHTFNTSREEEIVTNRLRIGHNDPTHSYLMAIED